MTSGKQLGEVHSAIGRVKTLLDPRRKSMSTEECVNSSNDIKGLAIDDVKRPGKKVSDSAVPPSDPSPGPAPAPTQFPAPASALAPAPAPDVNKPVTPIPKQPRVLAFLEQRYLDQPSASGRVNYINGTQDGEVQTVLQEVRLLQELNRYLSDGVQADIPGFSVQGFSQRKGFPPVAAITSEIVASSDIRISRSLLGCTKKLKPPAARPCATFLHSHFL